MADDRFQHFDPGDRFWTPAWDFTHSQPRTVTAVKKPNGRWHFFKGAVSEAEANLQHPLRTASPRRPGESRQVHRARDRKALSNDR